MRHNAHAKIAAGVSAGGLLVIAPVTRFIVPHW